MLTRISYQVGNPWMFDGKKFLPLTGHAHAEDGLHEQRVGARRAGAVDVRDFEDEVVYPAFLLLCHSSSSSRASSRAYGIVTVDFCMSHAPVGQRSAHSPQCTHRFSSFSITRAVCCSGADTNSGCSASSRAAFEPARQLGLGAVRRDREAVDGTDVDARVALDAEIGREHRLQVAVQAALDLGRDLLGAEAELDLDVQLLERAYEIDVRHDAALGRLVARCCSSTREYPSSPSSASRRAAAAPRGSCLRSACESRSRLGGRAARPR